MKETNAAARIIIALTVAVILLIAVPCLIDVIEPRGNASLHASGGVSTIKYSDSMLSLDLISPQSFVYDVSNDTVIYTKGEDRVVYPGSTTKLLTALYALTVMEPYEVVTPGNELELVKKDSSLAYVKGHHSLTVEMLVQGMLIPSGNDAAYALAAAVGKRLSENESVDGISAVEVFMAGLREYASDIGLCGTTLTVPDGYAGNEHFTTTEDMIIVSRLALENELIKKYVSMQSASVVYASGHTNNWTNTNKLLDEKSAFYSEYVTGLKTGSIDGEYSLIFSFELEDGRKYIAGVFGANNKDARFYDALKIIEKLK